MSRLRFTSYFLALAACATAALSSLPAPSADAPMPEDAGYSLQVASAH